MSAAIDLDAAEARVLGVLIEKEATTPDAYPLSLNAIASGCNQKSNRDPVMSLSEREVRDAVERLVAARLVREQGSAGGRVPRFAHRLANRLFGELEFTPAERAVLCVLLLRGAQTPGEIRARAARLADFDGVAGVERVLDGLAARVDGPHVRALPREPGRRELRWTGLWQRSASPPATAHQQRAAPEPDPDPEEPLAATPAGDAGGARVAALERRLDEAEAEIARLLARVTSLEHR